MPKLLVALVVANLALLGLTGCSSDSGNNPACVADYDLAVDGDACNENGDSSVCAGVSCACPGATLISHICFNGTCVTSIGNCDAWCSASEETRQSCF